MGHVFKAATDTLKLKNVSEDDYPSNLYDRIIYFQYNKLIMEADYSNIETIRNVAIMLRQAKGMWSERAEEVDIGEEDWVQELDAITYALGICHIYEFFKLKSSFRPRSANEITVPKNFKGVAYLAAIKELFSDSENESQKLTFLGVINNKGEVSKQKVYSIITGSNVIDIFIKNRSAYIQKVSSLLFPKPDIKYLLTNHNLTAALANTSYEPFEDFTQPQEPISSSSRRNDQDDVFYQNNEFEEDLGSLSDEDIIYNKSSKAKASKKAPAALVNTAALKKSPLLLAAPQSKINQASNKGNTHVSTELAKAKNIMAKHDNQDPLYEITNKHSSNTTKRPNGNPSVSASIAKKPRLIETRPDASKVIFDDDEIVDSDDEKKRRELMALKNRMNNNTNISTSSMPKSLKHDSPKGKKAVPIIVTDAGEVLLGKKGKWSFDEEQAFRDGLKIHGKGNWSTILQDPDFSKVLKGRTGVNLKDKWVNWVKAGAI